MGFAINISMDAMGGDNSPSAAVAGCIAALDARDGFRVILVGREEAIQSELKRLNPKNDYLSSGRLAIKRAAEVIGMNEPPVAAIKKKVDSSMAVALALVKESTAQAAVSAGNTGALLTGSLIVIGRVKSVMRPALGVFIPSLSQTGYTLLIDAGANMDCKPAYLAQFARMGSVYSRSMFGLERPRVGLLNVGEEGDKGNELTKKAYELLERGGLHFIGNLESRDLPLGGADVAVCDGFVGNIVLKHSEGLSSALFTAIKKELMSDIRSKLGAVLSKPAFVNLKKTFDSSEVGGALLLGLKGLVVKAHGNSNAKAFMNALLKAAHFVETGAQATLEASFENHGENGDGA